MTKAKRSKGRKTEIVEMTFTKAKNGSYVWKLGDVEGDSYHDTVLTLCEANVKIKLEILPDLKSKKVKEFPGVDLRYWRGQVIRQVR